MLSFAFAQLLPTENFVQTNAHVFHNIFFSNDLQSASVVVSYASCILRVVYVTSLIAIPSFIHRTCWKSIQVFAFEVWVSDVSLR